VVIGVHRGDSGYVNALGLRLIAGEVPADGTGSLITRSLAARLWPEGSALGQSVSGDRASYHIVGVVDDFVQGSMTSDAAGGLITMSESLARMAGGQIGRVSMTLATTRDASALVPQVEQVVAGIYPNAAERRVASGRQLLEADLGRERLGAAFFAGFGAVSLILGLAGVFGLVAYLAESRAREFGIRMALGATPRRVIHMIVGMSLVPVLAGATVGLGLAVLLSDTVSALVHGVGTLDVVSYVGAAALMVGGALAAGLVAALRIRRISPMDALRAE
jgi:ABC-type antimicrobial peptide transport system permease subunit